MSDFKGRHFGGEIVLWAVRWYCRYGISYRDLEQMMAERGISVDHSTIHRWVQRYAPDHLRQAAQNKPRCLVQQNFAGEPPRRGVKVAPHHRQDITLAVMPGAP